MSAKLSPTEALAIVDAVRAGETQEVIARRFGVSRPLIGLVARGLLWTHVTGLTPTRQARSASPVNPGAKLTPDEVTSIVAAVEAGEAYAAIAGRYGVDARTVSAIARGRYWSWLTGRTVTEHGAPRPSSRLSPEQVLAIVAAVDAGEQQRLVALRYGLSDTAVNGIVTGRSWSAVTGRTYRPQPGGPRRKPGRNASKLTAAQVTEIVAALEAGESQSAVAARFGVSAGMVGFIASGRAWGWLTGRGSRPVPPGTVASRARAPDRKAIKLTAADVAEIVAAVDGGEPYRPIALRYGVSRALVSHIANGRVWSAVTGRTPLPSRNGGGPC